jgi:dethiobiotin synthetase
LRGLFVTGTDTAAGKTVLSSCLLAAMLAAGEHAIPCKPVLTGLDEPPPPGWPADDELLGTLAGIDRHAVSPLRFGPAVSPHLAAELAGAPIDPEALLARTLRAVEGAGVAVVEGVGGLLVPLSGGYLVRDLAVALSLPVVVAARPGLGTINHTLLTLEAARSAGLEVCAVVLTPWPDAPGPIERSNLTTIASLGSVEVVPLELLRGPPDADEMARIGATLPWQRWLCDPAVRSDG